MPRTIWRLVVHRIHGRQRIPRRYTYYGESRYLAIRADQRNGASVLVITDDPKRALGSSHRKTFPHRMQTSHSG